MGMAMARPVDYRRSDRVPVRLVTTGHDADIPLTLLNLSTTGMLLSSPRALRVGDRVEVDLPDIGETAAQVMWSDTDEYGCQFLRPIPESVVWAAEAASRRNRNRSRQPRPAEPARRVAAGAAPTSDSRALVLLVTFLAVTVLLFYAGQEIFGL